MKKISILFIFSICIFGCHLNVKLKDPPIDSWGIGCSQKHIRGVPLTCTGNNYGFNPFLYQQKWEGGAALVLFVEPGNFGVGTSGISSIIKTNDLLPALVPHFRNIVTNFFYTTIEQLIVNYGNYINGKKKYTRIYVVKEAIPWSAPGDPNSNPDGYKLKNEFLATLRNAAMNHDRYDVLIFAHGNWNGNLKSPGNLMTHRNGFENLSGNELYTFLRGFGPLRNRLRAVFNTACWSHIPYTNSHTHWTIDQQVDAGVGISIAGAFRYGGTHSVVYGHDGVNSAPYHKDIVAFENWFKGKTYQEALLWGESYLKNRWKLQNNYYVSAEYCDVTQYSTKCRLIAPPPVQVRGCVSGWLGTVCQNKVYPTGVKYYLTNYEVARSTGVIRVSPNGSVLTRIDIL